MKEDDDEVDSTRSSSSSKGKYLKLAFESLSGKNFVEIDPTTLGKVCPKYGMEDLCVRQGTDDRVSPFCIDRNANVVLQTG